MSSFELRLPRQDVTQDDSPPDPPTVLVLPDALATAEVFDDLMRPDFLRDLDEAPYNLHVGAVQDEWLVLEGLKHWNTKVVRDALRAAIADTRREQESTTPSGRETPSTGTGPSRRSLRRMAVSAAKEQAMQQDPPTSFSTKAFLGFAGGSISSFSHLGSQAQPGEWPNGVRMFSDDTHKYDSSKFAERDYHGNPNWWEIDDTNSTSLYYRAQGMLQRAQEYRSRVKGSFILLVVGNGELAETISGVDRDIPTVTEEEDRDWWSLQGIGIMDAQDAQDPIKVRRLVKMLGDQGAQLYRNLVRTTHRPIVAAPLPSQSQIATHIKVRLIPDTNFFMRGHVDSLRASVQAFRPPVGIYLLPEVAKELADHHLDPADFGPLSSFQMHEQSTLLPSRGDEQIIRELRDAKVESIESPTGREREVCVFLTFDAVFTGIVSTTKFGSRQTVLCPYLVAKGGQYGYPVEDSLNELVRHILGPLTIPSGTTQ